MAETPTLAETPPSAGVYRRFASIVRPHRARVAAALLVNLLSAASLVAFAPLIGQAIDALIDESSTGLWVAVAALAGTVLARVYLLRTAEVLLTGVGERIVRSLRDRAVAQIAGAPMRFIEAHRTGDLLRRTTGEVAAIAEFVRSHLPDLVSLVFSLTLTLVVLLSYSWLLTLVTLALTLPATLVVIRWFRRDAHATFSRAASAKADLIATYNETLAGREALHLAGGMRYWRRRFAARNAAVLGAELRTVDVQLRLRLISFYEGVSVAILLVGGVWLAGADHITVGTVAVFVLALATLFDQVFGLSQVFGELQATAVSLARLLDLLDLTVPDGPDGPERNGATAPGDGDLELRGVRYAYRDGVDVLHDVDLVIPDGSHVAIAGRTGSGKSTLVKIASRLYRPDRGTVTFGGVDLGDLPEDEVRSRIVLVPQQVHLVNGTVADNLALVPREPSRDELLTAVHRLGLDSWLDGLPQGLDTRVGPHGELLSAGEQQLVGLVRAALVDPAVLILDEATADLDADTAARIEHAVDRLRSGRTLIVVAHRPETIARQSFVVHVEDGRVSVDDGRAGPARPSPSAE